MPPAHSARLFAAFADATLVVSVGCDHNGIRTAETYIAVESFLRTKLGLRQPKREPFAVAMDKRLCCLAAPIAENSEDARPNFGALAPWTIEKNSKILLLVHAAKNTLCGRRRYFDDDDDDDDDDDNKDEASPNTIVARPLEHHHHPEKSSFNDDDDDDAAAAAASDTSYMEAMQRAALAAAAGAFK